MLTPSFLYLLACEWGNKSWFNTLAIVNKAAMKTEVEVCLWNTDFVSFETIPRHGISGWYGKSIYNFWGHVIQFSTVAASIYIPTNSLQAFPFFTSLKY